MKPFEQGRGGGKAIPKKSDRVLFKEGGRSLRIVQKEGVSVWRVGSTGSSDQGASPLKADCGY